ncbi:MAG: TolC family protein [Spirochaetaceae bacterium]|jgi:outer membrane protein TolC|nr:TolC family protein [Spirochaetaceae bacterium]
MKTGNVLAIRVCRKRVFLVFFFKAALGLGAEQGIGFAEAALMAVNASDELRNEYALRTLREGAWVLGRRAYLPRLSLNVSEDDRVSTVGSDSFLKNYGISLDQLLWDGGRTAISRSVERAELTLLGAQLERMAGEIAEAALGAYRNVLYVRAQLAIREAALEVLGEQRNILFRETELGLALPSDLAGADLTLSGEGIEILSLKMELEEAEQALAETLGLEQLPPLLEAVDVRRSPILPGEEAVRDRAQTRNPDLTEARYTITKKQAEARYARLSWMPTVRLTGGFTLSGQRYPLTRYNWTVGLAIEFSSPWFSGGIQGSAGMEPPHDRNARLQNTLSPLPDPAAAMTGRSADLALALEQKRFRLSFEKAGRLAVLAVEKCRLIDKRRILALESLELAAKQFRLAELRLNLGQITRLDLMDTRQEYTQKELSLVETAIALLEAERELERFLDLRPGELALFSGETDYYGGSHE